MERNGMKKFSRQGRSLALVGGLLPGLMLLMSSAPVQAATNIGNDGSSYTTALIMVGLVAFVFAVIAALTISILGQNKIVLAGEAILAVVLCALTYGQASSFASTSGQAVAGLQASTFALIPGVTVGAANSALSIETIQLLMN
jgi:hypothetical protein